jgi:hypothetical protein
LGAKACESDRVAERRRREGNGSFMLCCFVAEEKGTRYRKPIERRSRQDDDYGDQTTKAMERRPGWLVGEAKKHSWRKGDVSDSKPE